MFKLFYNTGLITLLLCNYAWTYSFDTELTLETDSGFKVKWIGSDPEWLTMEMSAFTSGYVAVGFSPNGGMKNSDIVMGWVDSNGEAHIKDLHAPNGNAPLKEDEESNVEILHGSERRGVTTITFRRKWLTCDTKHDFPINMDTIRLIWAWSPDDPLDRAGNFNPDKYHGATRRGVRSVHFQDETVKLDFPPDRNPPAGIKYWDLMMDKVEVNEEDTTYFCKLYKAPKLDKKHQMIGFKGVVQPENVEFVHHILIYECVVPNHLGGSAATFEKYLKHSGARCFSENMPPEWGQYCLAIPLVWSVGHEGHMYPEHVGVPIHEEHGGTTYFLLEMHYDNPRGKSFVDSSGLRMYLTSNVRQYDLNTLLVGTRFSPFNTMPQGLEAFKSRGVCTSECTEKEFPDGGITGFQIFPHGHLAMTGITVRHIRNGVELPPIIKDSNYDFNYQQTRILPKEVKILPGDDIMVECDTSTKTYNRTVFGGIQTREEMCLAFIYYYPRMKLTECRTDLEINSYMDGLGVKKYKGDILNRVGLPYTPKEGQYFDPPDITLSLQSGDDRQKTYEQGNMFDYVEVVEPRNFRGKSVGEILEKTPWASANERLAHILNKKWLNGDYYAFCSHEGRVRVPLDKYIIKMPEIIDPYVDPDDSKCAREAYARRMEPRLRTSLTNSGVTNLGNIFLAIPFYILYLFR